MHPLILQDRQLEGQGSQVLVALLGYVDKYEQLEKQFPW